MSKADLFENIKIAVIIALTCLVGWGVINGLNHLTDLIQEDQRKREIKMSKPLQDTLVIIVIDKPNE